MRARRSRRAGYTLLEVLIALVIVCVIVVSSFSVTLVSRQNRGRIDRRTAAALATREVAQKLKMFVTADRTLAHGPDAGVDGWSLHGDRCNCYALADGQHNLDPAVWMPSLAAAPYNGTISYTVATTPTAVGPQPTVTFAVNWSEP